MLLKKALFSLSAASLLASCGTVPSQADGCGGYPDPNQASADKASRSDAAPIYYMTENTNDKTADQDYIGTPGYYAVNGLPPPSPKQGPTSAPLSAPRATASSGTYAYTIEPGDTVYALARKNCVSIHDIKKINRINRKFEILAGDTIILPKGRCKV